MEQLLRCGLVLLGLTAAGGGARADLVYLAIGDSSAFGETDRTRNPSNGDRGYVAPFADYLATRNNGVRPAVVNAAINGETTRSYTSGLVADRASTDGVTLNTNYAPYRPNYPSQDAYVRSVILAQAQAGNTIGTVTVQLGANDLDVLASSPGFLGLSPAEQQARIEQALGTVGQNYGALLTGVRTLLPNADLYVIGYHNPYGGAPGHPLYTLASPAIQGLNGVIAGVDTDPAFGGTYVDFYTPVVGRERELTLIDLFPGDLVNYVHLNDAGYEVESRQLIAAANANHPVPAPPAAVLAALGGLAFLIRRRVRAE